MRASSHTQTHSTERTPGTTDTDFDSTAPLQYEYIRVRGRAHRAAAQPPPAAALSHSVHVGLRAHAVAQRRRLACVDQRVLEPLVQPPRPPPQPAVTGAVRLSTSNTCTRKLSLVQ